MLNPHTHRPPRALTWRALLLGIGFCVLLSIWSQYAELVIHGTQISLTFPPIGGFFFFICTILVLNIALKRLWAPAALAPSELVIVFAMITVAAGMSSIDMAQKWAPMLTGVFYYAGKENRYLEAFHQHIPPWLAPSDSDVVRGLYEGAAGGVPWDAWMAPLLWWSAFMVVLYFVMMCVVTLVRRQWVENERLIFPLVAVPLEMSEEADPGALANRFFSSRVMWMGFGISFALLMYNGIHGYLPQVPILKACNPFYPNAVRVELYELPRPLNALRYVQLAVLPWIIGFAYLFTTEVAFSLWFFFWVGKLESVFGVMTGLDGLSMPGASGGVYPFAGHQTAGAYVGLILSSLWLSRRQLGDILRHCFREQEHVDDSDEPMSYRTALFGGLAGVGFLCWWCSHAGMSVLLALTMLSGVLTILLAMTRLMAEGGMPWAAEPKWGVPDMIHAGVGTRGLSDQNWTALGMQFFTTYDLRVSLMPRALEFFKLTERTGTSNRQMTVAVLVAILVSIPVSQWAFISAGYEHGGLSINSYRFITLAKAPCLFLERVNSQATAGTSWLPIAFAAIGAAKVAFLMFMRVRFSWWPFHPVGYAMSFIVYMQREWLSVFLGWITKTLLLRYGGMTAYQRARPFFLGLILGSCFAGGVWLIMDGFTGLRDHKILY